MILRDEPNLFRLVYRSRSDIDGSTFEAELIIAGIVETARRRNAEDAVTGSLMHARPFFLQALEGSAAAVEAVFDRICCDQRHGQLEIFECGPILERAFGKETMRYFTPSDPSAIKDADDVADVAAIAIRLFAEHCQAGPRKRAPQPLSP